jgi:putative phosphoribosyl transferase
LDVIVVLVVNERVVRAVSVGDVAFVGVQRRERDEVRRRARRFRGDRARLPLAGRTALVVDDGIATGSTARAACRWRGPTGRRGWCWRRRCVRPMWRARSKPSRSAPSIIARAIRSLYEPVGLCPSSFTHTSAEPREHVVEADDRCAADGIERGRRHTTILPTRAEGEQAGLDAALNGFGPGGREVEPADAGGALVGRTKLELTWPSGLSRSATGDHAGLPSGRSSFGHPQGCDPLAGAISCAVRGWLAPRSA